MGSDSGEGRALGGSVQHESVSWVKATVVYMSGLSEAEQNSAD